MSDDQPALSEQVKVNINTSMAPDGTTESEPTRTSLESPGGRYRPWPAAYFHRTAAGCYFRQDLEREGLT